MQKSLAGLRRSLAKIQVAADATIAADTVPSGAPAPAEVGLRSSEPRSTASRRSVSVRLVTTDCGEVSTAGGASLLALSSSERASVEPAARSPSARSEQGARSRAAAEPETFTLGLPILDEAIGGGLLRAALHEVFGEGTANAAAAGVVLALALRSGGTKRDIIWIRQKMAAREFGELHAAGLAAFGADPAKIIQVRVRSGLEALRAGHEALRCPALGSVVIEPWGVPKTLDLTATLRLARAAARSGVSAFLMRSGTSVPSAAFSRWSVRALPSVPLAANAPGAPVFEIELLRHRAGLPPGRWRVEWDRDQLKFREPPLSGAVAAVSADRPVASSTSAGAAARQRAG